MSDVQENAAERVLGWARTHWTLPLWLIAIILLLASTVVDLSISYSLDEVREALPEFLFTKLATHVTRDIGLSMLIGLFVSSVIERRHRAELRSSLNSRIQSISENVFSGVYNTDIPKAIVSEAVEQILKAKVVRSELDINYTIKIMSVTLTNGETKHYSLLSAIAQFSLSNISYDEAKVELGVVLPNPQVEYLFGSVKVTRFRINDKDVDDLEPRNKHLQDQLRSGADDCKFSAGERILSKKESVKVHAEYQMVKEDEDNEFLRSLYPTESLTIRVYYNSDEISAPRARSIHAQKLTQIAAGNSPNLRIWRIERPLLPQQGVVFWWKRR